MELKNPSTEFQHNKPHVMQPYFGLLKAGPLPWSEKAIYRRAVRIGGSAYGECQPYVLHVW
jgi:hypothetical protein